MPPAQMANEVMTAKNPLIEKRFMEPFIIALCLVYRDWAVGLQGVFGAWTFVPFC